MPHFVLEYSPQAKDLLPLQKNAKDDWRPLFHKFHSIMNDNGIAPASRCKSRAYPVDNFLLGDDDDDDDEEAGFVHLTVSFLDAPVESFHSNEKLRLVGDKIKAAMVEFFGGAAGNTGKVEFSVELRIMPKEMYWKHTD
jgi:5-carboxymethyl-2-hydroxymuconate isomerase